MRVLGLESSGPRGGAALIEDGRVLGESLFEKGMVHGRDLAPAADRLLKAAGLRPADLDLIAVDIGPGSYTGLRVGLAAAKGLAVALGKPILGVPSLDALARAAAGRGTKIATVIDAKWDQVYAAIYEIRAGVPVRISEMFAETPEAFAARLTPDLLVVGDTTRFGGKESEAPKPSVIATIAMERYLAGSRDDVATIVPLYLRQIEAEIKLGKKKQ